MSKDSPSHLRLGCSVDRNGCTARLLKDSRSKAATRNVAGMSQMNRTLLAFAQLLCITLVCVIPSHPQSLPLPSSDLLPAPPQVSGEIVLRAVNSPVTGKGVFVFDGHETPPLIRTAPGAKLRLTYINDMSQIGRASCRERV